MSEYQDVLEYCNGVREQLRRAPVKSLRKGEPVNACRCPVAATINYGCRNLMEIDGSMVVYPSSADGPGSVLDDCPEYVKQFIIDFDCGRLPQFKGEGWAE